MTDRDDKIIRLKSALKEATPAQPDKPKRTPRRKPAESIAINGDGNIVGNGNTVIKTEKVVHRPKVEVKTGDGVITAEQKARLQQLVKDWVSVREAVRKTDLSFAGAWAAVNKQAKVNSYHEIPSEKFSAVESWLLTQIAIVNAMPSASKKSKTWRDGRIRSIQARCNKLSIQDKRKIYMLKNFGKDTLTMLSDDEIEKVYRWAMGKR